jgi:UDP-N-acetylglucosamine transferase subunit ALG13
MERNLVFVTVGTDHHPFDRLCAWADAWVAAGRHPEVPWFVQSGTSKAPVHAPARDYIRYDEMCDYMSRAVAVVCHGGPATIMDARKLGRVPIVLPRNADLGEHVDNHQQRFARKMAELGEIHLVTTQDEMFELVEKAIADPTAFATSTDGAAIAAAVAKFEELVDGLFDRPGRGVSPQRKRARR